MISFPSSDQQRIYWLYHYLFTGLAMVRKKKDGQPNYRAISDRLSTNGEFRRTVSELFTLFNEAATGNEEIEVPTTLQKRLDRVTTGDVVKMLVTLGDRLNEDYRDHRTSYLSVLHPDDILDILHRLIELTPDERHQLGITNSDNLTLLKRAFLALQQSGGIENSAAVFQFYQQAMGLKYSNPSPLHTLEEVDEHIRATVAQLLTYLPYRPGRSRDPRDPNGIGSDQLQVELTQKAQREIRRILARGGNQYSPISDNLTIDAYIYRYFDRSFVTKLAQTVVTNERLTDQFPVYLKRLSVRACGPLPFADKKLGNLRTRHDAYWPLLHPAFRQLEQGMLLNPVTELHAPGDYELASQDATQVIAEFYIKVPEDYNGTIPRVFEQLASAKGDRIDFSLSSRGIGGSLSHAVKAINQALLRNIPCLDAYFSIGHDVTSTQKIIQDNVPSPVWAHNLVKLCARATFAQTLMQSNGSHFGSYEDVAFAEPIGHGDYCGFDFFQAQAQAAFHGRLQAIRHTGVNPKRYLHDLCRCTEQRVALNDAWSYFKGYPFSSFAMIGTIQKEILPPEVRHRALTLKDSYLYFEGYLSMIEVLLDEGSYRSARSYFDKIAVLDKVVQQGLAIADSNHTIPPASFTIFSSSVIIRYLICLANAYYLYDTRDPDPSYCPPGCAADIDRKGLVRLAWETLEHAHKHIQIRLRKYVLINEISQATFHPHYALLARVALLRMKLLLVFSQYVPIQPSLITDRCPGPNRSAAATHWGRLYFAEKTRLYMASDGDGEVYACHAAIQAWLHLMAAYASEDDLRLPSNTQGNNHEVTLSPKYCLDWARTLRDHALISYAEAGETYYYQIKEKSGFLPDAPPLTFGCHQIARIPAIYEAWGADYERLCQRLSQGQTGDSSGTSAGASTEENEDEFWVLDMSLLAIDPQHLRKLSPNHPQHRIYLFGTNACYLFFARGLYLLCNDTTDEFDQEPETENEIDWVKKLTKALRLLNLAWAIAEEGGDIHPPNSDAPPPVNLMTVRPHQR